MADGFEPRFVDLVRNFTTTGGTSDFMLGSAVAGFTSFTSALSTGDRFYYCATHVEKPAEREIGRGTLLAGGKIQREPLSDTPTNFSSGTKTVALVVPAEWFAEIDKSAASGTDIALVTAEPYNAKGDGVTDDSAAIAAAMRSGKKVVFPKPPGGKYLFASGASVELFQPLDVDFGGHEIEFAGASLTLTAPRVAATRTLAVNAARQSTTVTLDDATGIQAGDLIDIVTTVAAETGWGQPKKDVVKVRSVSGNTLELEEPLMFAYSTGDAGLRVEGYRPQPVRMTQPFVTTAAASVMISFAFLENVEVFSPRLRGAPEFDSAADIGRIGFRFFGCWNTTVRNASCAFMSYPLMPGRGARRTLIDGVTASKCRHPVSPSDWPKGVVVKNLRASDCHAGVDSHPAFDVTYDQVQVERDRELPNLRCVGATLRNCRVQTDADDAVNGPYFHSLVPSADTASYLYSDADIRFENVEIIAPDRTLPLIRVERARTVYVDGLSVPANGAAFSNGSLNAVGEVLWGPNNQIGGRPSPSRSTATGVRCPIRIMQPAVLNAYVDGGIYHVDPRLQMVDQSNARLSCRGSIAKVLTGASSFTLPIRIHTNAFGHLDSVTYVQGRLTLRAKARHSSGGMFAALEKEFNFFHKATATSAVTFPLAPVSTSTPSGQTNESNLTLTIANPSQAGASEVGPGGDFHVGIDATFGMSVVASPVFDLDYSLELEVMQ